MFYVTFLFVGHVGIYTVCLHEVGRGKKQKQKKQNFLTENILVSFILFSCYLIPQEHISRIDTSLKWWTLTDFLVMSWRKKGRGIKEALIRDLECTPYVSF